MRNVSAPHFSMYASGTTTFPRDFDILAPSLIMVPCARNRGKGSSNARNPRSCSTIEMNPRVHEVKNGMFVPPDIGGHGQPLLGELLVKRAIVETRRRVTKVVPGRIQKRVGYVGLATRVFLALRTGDPEPLFVPGER